jgi:hypothetical protein
VKPVKYSYFTIEDPKTFKNAVNGPNSKGWKQAVDAELDNIERHKVWHDHMTTPPKALKHTWVFKTKPATNSSPVKQKA